MSTDTPFCHMTAVQCRWCLYIIFIILLITTEGCISFMCHSVEAGKGDVVINSTFEMWEVTQPMPAMFRNTASAAIWQVFTWSSPIGWKLDWKSTSCRPKCQVCLDLASRVKQLVCENYLSLTLITLILEKENVSILPYIGVQTSFVGGGGGGGGGGEWDARMFSPVQYDLLFARLWPFKTF